ncbi:MAG: DUF2784 domain-containing protein [Desulfofustis sp.]|nr:DUF2784 domain-containing protein [Desulfofustis sp.]
MESFYPIAADAILVVHFAFIIFVVGGQLCVIAGYFRKWCWVRNLAFRVCHLLAIGVVVAQAWLGRYCPLTIWESRLRQAAGQPAYQGSFVQEWVGKLIYYDAPLWVFAIIYSLFGALVLASWIWVKPRSLTSLE